MDLFAFILIITYVFINFISLLVIQLYKGSFLNIKLLINIYTTLKNNSLSYQNIFYLVIFFNSIFILKTFFVKYVMLYTSLRGIYNLIAGSTDGDSGSQGEPATDNNNGDPNPDSDVSMGSSDENTDEESEEESDNEYPQPKDLGCNETKMKYNDIKDIPSYQWSIFRSSS